MFANIVDADTVRLVASDSDSYEGPLTFGGVIAWYVREKRKEAGLSQADLGTKAKISQNHLSNLERGKRAISGPHLDAIFEALGILHSDAFHQLSRVAMRVEGKPMPAPTADKRPLPPPSLPTHKVKAGVGYTKKEEPISAVRPTNRPPR